MKVSSIEIINILGIKELKFSPGKVTEVTGKNGAGKSSVLEAVKAVLKGGSQAHLLRNGEEEGQIVFVLDNGIEIRKIITKEETQVKMTHPEHGKVSSPAKMIAGLADALSVNPVDFLTADPKKRIEVLMETMPLKIDPETMKSMVGNFDFMELSDVREDDHALKILDKARKAAFNRRQDVNRTAKEKRSTVEQLSTGIERPRATVGDLKAEAEVIAALLKPLNAKRDERVAELSGLKLREMTAEQDWREKEIQRIRDDFELKINAITTRYSEPDELRQAIEAEIAEKEKTAEAIKTEIERAIKSQTALDAVDMMTTDAQRLELKSEALTECIHQLEQAKVSLLKVLPIQGIEIKDGVLLVDGVDFETVNKAKRVEVAVKIAKLRAKQLGMVCVDEAENLDDETFALLEAELEKSGLQLITGRVSNGCTCNPIGDAPHTDWCIENRNKVSVVTK